MSIRNFLQSSPIIIIIFLFKRVYSRGGPIATISGSDDEIPRKSSVTLNFIGTYRVFHIFSKVITVFTSGSDHFMMIS